MSSDIDIEEHDLLEHPTLRGVFPDLSLVKQEVEFDDDVTKEEEQKKPLYDPVDENSCDTVILDTPVEKPDSTSDLVLAILSTPAESPLVTSSQSVAPSPNTSPELPDSEYEAETSFEAKCFQSYVSVQDWGPYLDNSKCYCGECEILFSTENAIAAHNMVDHSYLEEVSTSSTSEYQIQTTQSKKFAFGSKQENSVYQCGDCPAKFTRFYNLKKHKIVIHGETLGETTQPLLLTPKVVNVQTVANNLSPNVANEQATVPDTEKSDHLCQSCNMSLPTQKDLIAHLYDHFTSQYMCALCKIIFPQKIQLDKHTLQMHSHSRHSAPSSSRYGGISQFTSNSSLVGESSKNPDASPKEKSSANSLQVNYNKHEKYIKCDICALCHVSVYRYKKHMLLTHQKYATSTLEHQVVTQLYCEQCEKAFQNIKQYNGHMQICHIVYNCPGCKKQFKGAGVLGFHKKKCPLVQPTQRNPKVKAVYSKNVIKLGSNTPKIVKKVESKPLKVVAVKPMLKNSRLKVQLIYKCNVCQQSFPRYHLARSHRDRLHADSPLSRVISRDTQKLILKKAPALANTKQSSVAIPNSKDHANIINQKTKKTMMLNIVLHCPTCNIGFITWMGAKSHQSRGCGPLKLEHTYKACDICHIRFQINKLSVHKQLHKSNKKLHITTLTEFNQNAYRTLHKCVDCRLYSSAKKIMLEHFVGSSVEHTNCEICGYRIAGGNMKYHLDEHKKYNLTKDDYIIIEYCHTDRLKLHNAKVSDNEASEPQSQGTEDPALNSAKNLQLMQCQTCKHHMNPSYVAKLHKDKKCHFVKYQICEHCGLSFTTTGYVSHLLQHRQSAVPLIFRDFDIRDLSGNKVSVRLTNIMKRLFRCKCGAVARSGIDIGHHRKYYYVKNSPCLPERSIRCKICKLIFTEKSYTWHLKFHKADTVARLTGPSNRGKRPKSVTSKEVTDDIVFLRCDKCHLHIRDTKKNIYRHKSSNCKDMKRVVCVQCGLTLPAKTQMTLKKHTAMYHKSSSSLTMTDFTILRMSNREPVGRESSRFPCCKACGLHVEGPERPHESVEQCKEDDSPKTTCSVCGLTFVDTVYHLHLPYAGCDRAEERPPVSRKRKATEMNHSDEIKKLMTNYNKMDQAWSQLYQCAECQVLVDSYDEVLTHCERHQSASYEPTLIMCHVCDLNFDQSSFQRHKEQHFTRPGIERSRFEVFEFKPTAYKTAMWEYYKNAITGNRVSYILKQDGPEQHTIYQCARCKLFCSSKLTAYRHTTHPQYCNTPSVACEECGLTVHSESVPEHEKYHALNPDLTSSSFRIFWFTNETTEETGEMTPKTKKNKSTLKVPTHSNPLLYKCVVCKVHFVSKMKADKHIAHSVHARTPRRANCPKCGFLFYLQSLPKHKALHHGRTDYRQKDFTVLVNANNEKVPVYKIEKSICNQTPAPKNGVTNTQITQNTTAKKNHKNKLVLGCTAKKFSTVPGLPQGFLPKTAKKINPTLYKCAECELHFLTYGTAQPHVRYDHIRECKSNKKVCPTCNLAFRGKSYHRHVIEHHRKANYKADDFDIYVISSDGSVHVKAGKTRTAKSLGTDTIFAVRKYTRKIGTNEEKVQKKTILFRCSLCSAHFSKEKSINRHMELQSHNKSDVISCDICHYGFKGRTLTSHRYFHHGLRKLHTNDFKIIVKSPKNQVIKETESVVFKCSACDLCLLQKRTVQKHRCPHIERKTADLNQCKICQLYFTKISLTKHMRYHHPNGAKGTFNIVDVNPGVQSSRPILNDTSEDTNQVSEIVQSYENMSADYTNIAKPPKKQTINKRESAVFKCSACAVCFLHERTVQKHGFPHIKKEVTDLNQCKICQLHFTRISLTKHMRYHHSNGAKGTFKIVEVKPGEPLGELNTSITRNDISEDSNQVSEVEQTYENIEYLDEDASSEVTQNNAMRSAVASQDASKEASSSALQVPDAYMCPKCSTVFSTSIQLSIHKALDHLNDTSVQLDVRAVDTM